MSVVSHIAHLQAKHAELETLLADETNRPSPDFYTIKDIKKQKLLLKEEIARLLEDMGAQKQNVS